MSKLPCEHARRIVYLWLPFLGNSASPIVAWVKPLTINFIRRVQKARVQIQAVRAKSAAFKIRWDEARYISDLNTLQGLYLQPSYADASGQNRIGRKNIPNNIFDLGAHGKLTICARIELTTAKPGTAAWQ